MFGWGGAGDGLIIALRLVYSLIRHFPNGKRCVAPLIALFIKIHNMFLEAVKSVSENVNAHILMADASFIYLMFE